MSEPTHIPVLAEEVQGGLQPLPGQNFVDGTLGLGGHAAMILEKTGPDGKLMGFDRDIENLKTAKKNLKKYGDRVIYINDSFSSLEKHLYEHGFDQLHGIILDLGFSSVHVDDPKRGFTFKSAGPLDMRYDRRQELTAEEIINEWSLEDLTDIFRRFGEERHARKIAKRITEERRRDRIRATDRLAEIIKSVVPTKGKRMRIHPATRVFQALRIAVNDELGELQRLLPQAMNALTPGGRLAVISFHSLEDRIVKHFIKKHEGEKLKRLSKKPIVASETEIKTNPRSRSAKLRVAEKL